MAILTIVEASCLQKVSSSSSKLGRKGNWELKWMECYIIMILDLRLLAVELKSRGVL